MAFEAKYAVNYVGGVTVMQEKCDSLEQEGGPLVIANDHMWAKMLPEALPDGAPALTKMASETEWEGAAVGGLLLEAALARKNTHWAVGADRWAQLFKDLDEAGFDSSPILKPRDKAMPEASARLRAGCLQLLTPVQRTIKLTDVIQCWHFSHALMVALYVITLDSMCLCCISRSKLTAVSPCWSFSHVLMDAS